jgi:hypothetical protein
LLGGGGGGGGRTVGPRCDGSGNNKHSCENDTCGIVLAVFGGIFGLALLFCCYRCIFRCKKRYLQKKSIKQFIQQNELQILSNENIFNIIEDECIWNGNYSALNGVNIGTHSVTCTYKFKNGIITGSGKDRIGRFKIHGVYNNLNKKLAFEKNYICGETIIYTGKFDTVT